MPQRKSLAKAQQWALLPSSFRSKPKSASLRKGPACPLCGGEGMEVILGDQRVISQSFIVSRSDLPRQEHFPHQDRAFRAAEEISASDSPHGARKVCSTAISSPISTNAIGSVPHATRCFLRLGRGAARRHPGSGAAGAGQNPCLRKPRFDLLRPALRDIFRDDVERDCRRTSVATCSSTRIFLASTASRPGDMLRCCNSAASPSASEQKAYYKSWFDHLGEVFHAFATRYSAPRGKFP